MLVEGGGRHDLMRHGDNAEIMAASDYIVWVKRKEVNSA
jgi:hypothetical protein